jgi:protein ImuB
MRDVRPCRALRGLRPERTARRHLPHPTLADARATFSREREKDEPPPPDRPIRLLAYPEAVEAVAAVPDGPPIRFRWRRVMHDVVAVEGPERIAPEWWKAETAALTRDYFRAEDAHGRRFWLFREGLYGRETPAPRWFLHGLFG